jgi:hypothetical protein
MPKDILVANFWWNMIRQPYKESFLRNKATELFSQGWRTVAHVWIKK